MKQRIFIHIGTHKTGTTSIQFFLIEQRDRLREGGIFVPRAGTGILDAPNGHHNIAYDLCGDSNHDRGLTGAVDLIAELRDSTAPTAVISSENLQFLHAFPETLRKFDQDLAAIGYDRTYLVYFRNQDDYFTSLYSQLAVTQRLPDATFQSLREQAAAQGYIVDRVNRRFEFDRGVFAQKWQNIVGPHLQIFDYDQAARDSNLLPEFLTTIGASAELIGRSRQFPRYNVTMIGRNEACPCQSGKRYKHCHGVMV